MKTIKVYLGDLRYFTGGTCFPLGIGFLAAYAAQELGAAVETRLFIDPEQLAEAIRAEPPDLLGLANYSWNRNINTQFAALARSVSPDTITLMGGPCFARDDKDWLDAYFRRNPGLDFYVAGAGEFAFVEILKLMASATGDRRGAVRAGAFPGLFFRESGTVREGKAVVESLERRRRELDEIPSPYLTGWMDPFFAVKNLGPMIETVRGCPYSCTFCCWGSRLLNKVSSFSVERVKAEIEYIAERSVNCRRLFFGDANFGLLERDVEIARHLHELKARRNWPDDVYLYFSKNSGARVIEVARLLRGMTKVSLARQSMTESVLTNTKRANLDDESYSRIQAELGENQVESLVEIIYPLPGETRQSFTEGMDRIFRSIDPARTEIRLYPTELLPGSEMATGESRRKFGLKTGWRKLWGQAGTFGGVTACEYQEIVVTTDCFSMADQSYVRKLHFFFTIFLTYRLYDAVTRLYTEVLAERGIMALIERVAAATSASPVLGPLFARFEADTAGEFLFTDEPPADGSPPKLARDSRTDLAGAVSEQKRHNIHYALELLYGERGAFRAAFGAALRQVLVEMGAPSRDVDDALAAVEKTVIDFPALADGSPPPPAAAGHAGVTAFLADHPGGGNVVKTLYGLYSAVAAGHLDKLVLQR